MYRLNAETMPSATSGLRALVERPHDLPADFKWVQIMSKIPIDPWGAEYRYVLGEDYPDGFGLYSRGPDGVSATLGNDEDDINSWSGPNKPGRMSGDEILVRSAGYGIMLAVGYFLGMASGSKRHTEA